MTWQPSDASPAPPTAGYCVRDLFFSVRITEGLARLGLGSREIRGNDPGPLLLGCAMVIVDLSGTQEQWRPVIVAARAVGLPVLAFGSHMDQERWQEARRAGAGRIVAKSLLVQRFPELVQAALEGRTAGKEARSR